MKKTYALPLFILVVVIWGVNWTVTKLIVESITPIWSNAMRCLIAAVPLFFLQILTKQYIIPTRRDIPALFVVGIFHMTIFATLMAVGLQYISVGRSVVLGYTTPLWVTPAAIFFLREPINIWRIIGVALGIMGVCLLFLPSVGGIHSREAIVGHVLLLVASFSWAITIIGIKLITWHSTPFQLVLWQILLATVLSCVIALWLEGVPNIIWKPALLWQMAYSGVLATAFGFWGMTVINQHLPAIVTSLGLLATPVVGMIFSLLTLGEAIDTGLMVAGIFIFAGIGLGCVDKK